MSATRVSAKTPRPQSQMAAIPKMATRDTFLIGAGILAAQLSTLTTTRHSPTPGITMAAGTLTLQPHSDVYQGSLFHQLIPV